MKKIINKINYRPEIDFLRAISVSAVIIYHAQVNLFGHKLFQGGYLGVDVFFVISGYLITSIIFKELRKKKSFSFSKFYLKRARRILPALLFVILISLPLTIFILMPTGLLDFAKSILFSIGFSSNFYFYFTGLEYGAVSGLLKPLLHTWSLAVEEQFYLLFPLLFVTGFFIFKKNIRLYILIIFFLSFIFSEFFSFYNSNLNFYILPSRIWELLAGSLIVFYQDRNKIKVSNNISNMMCLIGLFLISFSFLYFYNSTPSPNSKNLIPIIGAVLIIIFSKKNAFITNFFSKKLFISIGLISYSLYLWHYPIFAFARNIRITQSITSYTILGLIILIISIISYFLIEKPFRDKKFITDKNFIKLIFISLLLLFIFAVTIIYNKGFESRFSNYDKFNTDYTFYLKQIRLTKYELGNPQFKDPNKKNVLVIGNSHGRDTFNSLKLNEELFPNYEFSILDTQIHCIIKVISKFEFCKKKMTRLEKKIFLDSDIILISSHYTEIDIDALEEIILKLNMSNKKVILTTQTPNYYFKNYFSLVDEFYNQNKRLPDQKEKILLEKEYYKTKKIDSGIINDKLKKISKNTETKLLEKKKLFCNEKTKRCQFLTEQNNKIYYDNYHLTIHGAIFIGQKIFKTKWLKLD